MRKALMGLSILMLVACAKQEKQSTETTQAESNVVRATQKQDNQDYRMLFIDGAYRTSQVRGYTRSLSTPENIAEFEKGLMMVSKSYFDPNSYYFAEGQFITKEEVNAWLDNKSDNNPNGLNQTGQGEQDVIMTILEQDYMILQNNNYEFSGVSIGLALNPKISVSKTLTDEELIEKGKTAATQLLAVLRQKEGFGGIPIVFGLFKQDNNSGASLGRYLTTASSTSGTTLSKWSDLTIEKRLFPMDKEATSEVNVFNGFKKTIELFFPNLNGVIGYATFVKGNMTELDITITTQFYGQAEMIAFQQFLVEQASKTYSATELAVKIKVQSVRGAELVVYKSLGRADYQSIILQ